MKKSHQKRTTFTLIELLVVIAIIAILAGMLLPALNKARQSAFSSQCVSNLKQVAVTVQLYIDNYQEWIHPNIINKPTTGYKGTSNYFFVVLLNYGFVKNPNIFVCPSFTPNKYKPTSKARYGETYGTMGNSGFAKLARAHELYVWKAKESLPPSRMLFYSDSIAGTGEEPKGRQMANWGWTYNQTANSNSIHLRHSKKANFSHMDGSVGTYGARDVAVRYRLYYNSEGLGKASGHSPAVRYMYRVIAY